MLYNNILSILPIAEGDKCRFIPSHIFIMWRFIKYGGNLDLFCMELYIINIFSIKHVQITCASSHYMTSKFL